MQILITGGTGFVGSNLARHFVSLGYRVTCLGSRPRPTADPEAPLQVVAADTTRKGDWQQLVPEQDAVVNLAGRSIFHLWNEAYKQQIHDSRVLTTRNLAEAMGKNQVLISASAAGYYGDSGDRANDEKAPPGHDFLAKVCQDWEAAALEAANRGARVAITRLGVVLGAGGGAIATMKLPFKFALGGPIGTGRQWFPWVHLEDVIEAVSFLLLTDSLAGPFNLTAPETVRQKEFARALGQVLHRPACLPTPAFALKLALGEFGATLLMGQKTVPEALTSSGYTFRHPTLVPALEAILGD